MSDQAAFQEVDDAVRQDDLKAWWKRWGTLLIVGFVLLIAVTIAVMQWRKYEDGQRAVAGAAYSAALAKIVPDNAAARNEARAELEKQAKDAPEPYRMLAALAAAQLFDKVEEQVAALEAVAPKLPPELADLALVIAAFKSADTAQADQVLAKLEPLTGPERAYRVSVRELQALAAQRKGDLKKAREIWTEIAKDTGAPQGALQRSQAMLNLYGAGEAQPGAKPPGAK